MTHERHLTWEACLNARDVGGYATADGGETRWGAFVRSDNLARLTSAGCEALIDYGVRTIIDLRSPSEVTRDTHPFAEGNSRPTTPRYLNIPLINNGDEAGMTAMSAANTQLASYWVMIDWFGANFAAVLGAFADAQPGTVLAHCYAGKDRTGLVTAMLLSVAGVSRETIVVDYAVTDQYLEPMYREIRAAGPQDPERLERLSQFLVSLPETMRAALEYIDEKYGGMQSYLRRAGLSDEEMLRIRNRLRR